MKYKNGTWVRIHDRYGAGTPFYKVSGVVVNCNYGGNAVLISFPMPIPAYTYPVALDGVVYPYCYALDNMILYPILQAKQGGNQ